MYSSPRGVKLAGLARTKLSFYLAKPKPAQIEIGHDRSPILSPTPHYPRAKWQRISKTYECGYGDR